jgi:hypothetical protein
MCVLTRKVPMYRNRYTFEGILDSTFVGSFDPAQEFHVRRGISAYVIGHGIGGKVIPAKMAQLA